MVGGIPSALAFSETIGYLARIILVVDIGSAAQQRHIGTVELLGLDFNYKHYKSYKHYKPCLPHPLFAEGRNTPGVGRHLVVEQGVLGEILGADIAVFLAADNGVAPAVVGNLRHQRREGDHR